MGFKENNPKYKPKAYLFYSIVEIGTEIGFLVKRAKHRSNMSKLGNKGRIKDLQDAKNYYIILGKKLDDEFGKLGFKFDLF
jgi:ABC-type lipoprotein release transport system permease subunit